MEGMDISSSNIDMYGNNSNQNNSLQKNMDTISLENPTLSYIPTKLITSTSEMVTIQEIRNAMKSFKIVYPNKDEIPLIKIKDENYLESGERIVDYVGLLTQYDDNKFTVLYLFVPPLQKNFWTSSKLSLNSLDNIENLESNCVPFLKKNFWFLKKIFQLCLPP